MPYVYTPLKELEPGPIEDKQNCVAFVTAVVDVSQDEMFVGLRDSSGDIEARLMSPGIGHWNILVGDILRIHRACVVLEQDRRTLISNKAYANCSIGVFSPQEDAASALKHFNFLNITWESSFLERFAEVLAMVTSGSVAGLGGSRSPLTIAPAPAVLKTMQQHHQGDSQGQSLQASETSAQDESTTSFDHFKEAAHLVKQNEVSAAELKSRIPLRMFKPRCYANLIVEVLAIFRTAREGLILRCWDGGPLYEEMSRQRPGGQNLTVQFVPDQDITTWESRVNDTLYKASAGSQVDISVFGMYQKSLLECRAGDIVFLGNVNYAVPNRTHDAYLVLNEQARHERKLVRLLPDCPQGKLVKRDCRTTAKRYCDKYAIEYSKLDEPCQIRSNENSSPVDSESCTQLSSNKEAGNASDQVTATPQDPGELADGSLCSLLNELAEGVDTGQEREIVTDEAQVPVPDAMVASQNNDARIADANECLPSSSTSLPIVVESQCQCSSRRTCHHIDQNTVVVDDQRSASPVVGTSGLPDVDHDSAVSEEDDKSQSLVPFPIQLAYPMASSVDEVASGSGSAEPNPEPATVAPEFRNPEPGVVSAEISPEEPIHEPEAVSYEIYKPKAAGVVSTGIANPVPCVGSPETSPSLERDNTSATAPLAHNGVDSGSETAQRYMLRRTVRQSTPKLPRTSPRKRAVKYSPENSDAAAAPAEPQQMKKRTSPKKPVKDAEDPVAKTSKVAGKQVTPTKNPTEQVNDRRLSLRTRSGTGSTIRSPMSSIASSKRRRRTSDLASGLSREAPVNVVQEGEEESVSDPDVEVVLFNTKPVINLPIVNVDLDNPASAVGTSVLVKPVKCEVVEVEVEEEEYDDVHSMDTQETSSPNLSLSMKSEPTTPSKVGPDPQAHVVDGVAAQPSIDTEEDDGPVINPFLENEGALLKKLQAFLLTARHEHFHSKLRKQLAEKEVLSWDKEACVVSDMNVDEMCYLSNNLTACPDRMNKNWKKYAIAWCLECPKCSYIKNTDRNGPKEFCPICFQKDATLSSLLGLTFRVNVPVRFKEGARVRFVELRIGQNVFSSVDPQFESFATENLRRLSEMSDEVYATKRKEILKRVKKLAATWEFLPMKSKICAQLPQNVATASVLNVLDCRVKRVDK